MSNSRSAISLTLLIDKIYISGDSKTIEVYDIPTNTFVSLNTKLDSIENFTTSVAYSNKIFIFSKDKCVEINPEKDEAKTIKNIPSGSWWSQYSPIVHESKILFSRFDDHSLWQFDAESLELKKITKF